MSVRILRTRLDLTSYADATTRASSWAKRGESRFICAANVHTLMEAWDSPAFTNVLKAADLVAPDGMPLVWMMRLKGKKLQERVYGPTLMLHILGAAEVENIGVGFYGSSPEVLASLASRLPTRYPALNMGYFFSPPYRDLNPEEALKVIRSIKESQIQILFVGLGCPKQELWMAEHRGKIPCVMIGVGAAFDFHAGLKPQAPGWMQQIGIEWLFRLFSEPGRLWWRYFFHNPRFILLAILDLLGFFR